MGAVPGLLATSLLPGQTGAGVCVPDPLQGPSPVIMAASLKARVYSVGTSQAKASAAFERVKLTQVNKRRFLVNEVHAAGC